MKLPDKTALEVIADLLNRTPMNQAELIGAQSCIDSIQSTLKEHADFKNPPKPEQ